MNELGQIEAWVEDGRDDEAAELLRGIVERLEPEHAADAARLAVRLGLALVAMRAWQVRLREHPDDAEAREELAVLYDERGEPERARAWRERRPAVEVWEVPTSAESSPSDEPSDADFIRFVDRFEGREGVHARMWHDPSRGTGYSPVRAPLTVDLVRQHLAGTVTLGSYVVRVDQTVRFVVLDVDAQRAALDAAMGDHARLGVLRSAVRDVTDRLRAVCLARGLDPLLEDSGYKGRHLWLFLDRPAAAGAALAFGRSVVAEIGRLPAGVHVDVFPRQAEVPPDGLGNLVKLPLGLHLRSGRRALLLDDQHAPLARPWERLAEVARRPLPVVDVAEVAWPPEVEPGPELPPEPKHESVMWTEASFQQSRWIAPVLEGCGVLRHVIADALENARIEEDGPTVLNHTLGHLPDGPDAVNYVYARLPDVAASARMGARHSGSPMGCRNIRSRLGAVVASGVPCQCVFAARAGDYAHPLRHLDDVDAEGPPPSLDDLLATYTAQLRRLAAVQEELDGLRRAAMRTLRAVPGRSWAVEGGEWRLVEEEGGVEVLQFATLGST